MVGGRAKPKRAEAPESKPQQSAAAANFVKNNIVVAVRCRPFNSQKERDNSVGDLTTNSCIKIADKKIVILLDITPSDDVLRQKRKKDKEYVFDFAYDWECKSEEVYEDTCKTLVDGVLFGYNSSVFAYGATGSGKTHTMVGTSRDPGIMVLTLRDLFLKVADSPNIKVSITMSYLEVYNEYLKDLLNPGPDNLDLREDPEKGVMVHGVSYVNPTSAAEVMEYLNKGNKNRTCEATAANKTSSRSHAVLQIIVEQRDATGNVREELRIGKLSLIDLAGSERASVSQNRGIRLIEGANINKSLLALGNCINALGEKGGNVQHIPYRDSKLTRLLKDSLGGNTRTVMITAISPSSGSWDETLNTLKYANRAKNIQTKISQNVLDVDHHISQYVAIIQELRAEVETLKAQLMEAQKGGPGGRPATADEKEKHEFENARHELENNHLDHLRHQNELLELEEAESVKMMEKSSKESERNRYNTQYDSGGRGDRPMLLHKLDRDLHMIDLALARIAQQKEAIRTKIKSIVDHTELLMKEVPKVISNPRLRGHLDSIRRAYTFELQNHRLSKELERHRQVLAQRESYIQKLRNPETVDRRGDGGGSSSYRESRDLRGTGRSGHEQAPEGGQLFRRAPSAKGYARDDAYDSTQPRRSYGSGNYDNPQPRPPREDSLDPSYGNRIHSSHSHQRLSRMPTPDGNPRSSSVLSQPPADMDKANHPGSGRTARRVSSLKRVNERRGLGTGDEAERLMPDIRGPETDGPEGVYRKAGSKPASRESGDGRRVGSQQSNRAPVY
eukprot:TRINITY_DN3848_c0_g1_i3.p1 TRINITY_DN3848_c0_g1~~TRINITY_DN3848_c0_g1_i3.p1  ORF type:complete len:789 (+),score=127.94 TRINITY_DN3848_c0_g1_i3:114-2480(+)